MFSGVPYLASPLTLNHDWLGENLNRLHVGTIGDLGTAIGDAIVVATKRLKAVPNSKSRVIILLTDGDNNKGEIETVSGRAARRCGGCENLYHRASASKNRATCRRSIRPRVN